MGFVDKETWIKRFASSRGIHGAAFPAFRETLIKELDKMGLTGEKLDMAQLIAIAKKEGRAILE